MAAVEVLSKIYRPSMQVGQVYARPYGSTTAHMPVGNVLELALEHSEEVETQEDMTRLGGGTHAEVRRVKEVKTKIKFADLNIVNLARASLGTVAGIEAGTVTKESRTATLGGLIMLTHIQPTAITLKQGADEASATAVNAAGNYEVRPEGIYVFPNATELTDGAKVWIDYSYGEYAVIEALTTKAVELDLLFGGLNEADGGKAQVQHIFRCSQGIAKSMALLGKGFGNLEVEGTVLMDPTKVGVGISRYYKTSIA